MIGERLVALKGGINFRDLGGYDTSDGRRTRWGRLFRSGQMRERHGSIDNYLREALDVTDTMREQMNRHLLEPA